VLFVHVAVAMTELSISIARYTDCPLSETDLSGLFLMQNEMN